MPTSFGRGGAWISWLVEALRETVMVDASGVGRERRAGFVLSEEKEEGAEERGVELEVLSRNI